MYSASIPALVDSLFHNPFYQAITVDFDEDVARRRSALADYFSYSMSEGARTGRCVVASDPHLGAAIWLLPRTPDVEASEREMKSRYLANILGPQGNENYHRIIAFMSPYAAQIVAADAWYLSIVGVSPAAQGKGIGADLIRPTLLEAKQAGVQCYLETFTPRNQSFYRRMGFRAISEYLEPITGKECVVMSCDA